MAKATFEPEAAPVILQLTTEEAELLTGVLGDFTCTSPTAPIFDALYDAGVKWDRYHVEAVAENAFEAVPNG